MRRVENRPFDDDELAELENPDTWEEHGEILPPVSSPVAVVRIRFAIRDFETVGKSAQRRGLKLTDFIRLAAIEMAQNDAPMTMAAATDTSASAKDEHAGV